MNIRFRRPWFACVSCAVLWAVGPSSSRAQSMGGMGGMGGFGGPGGGAPGRPSGSGGDVLPEVSSQIADDPQKVFAAAEKAFAEKDWLEAIAHYQHLQQRFSYLLKLVTEADLRLADIAFAREKWTEARGLYRTFVRLHPRHERAEYAAFQGAKCLYLDLPGDGFLQPAAAERDQAEVASARQELDQFVDKHARSEFVSQARDMSRRCASRLAAHELAVAEYYAEKGKWAGVLLRAEGLLRQYPDSDQVGQATVLVIRAHVGQGHADQAQKWLDQLRLDPTVDGRVIESAQQALELASASR